jgi:hypothetical protein
VTGENTVTLVVISEASYASATDQPRLATNKSKSHTTLRKHKARIKDKNESKGRKIN